jgi:uncharacterized lipoprotein YehR (DUF1307 family)
MKRADPLQEEAMKLVARIVAVLAAAAVAVPAFACGDKESTKTADSKPAAAQSQRVAKSDAKKKAAHAKKTQEAKPAATASN